MVIKNKYQDLEYKKELLFRKVRSRYESKEREFLVLAERLNGLSPLNKLKGGYGYVSDDTGKPMLSVKNVKKGDSLSIRLKDGTVMTKAEEIIYTE